MFVTADQLFSHIFGDYVVQSDYMAANKTKSSLAAFAHAMTYTACFLPLASSWSNLGLEPDTWVPQDVRWSVLLFIMTTHFVIDRWRLARYVCWAKNFLAPKHIEVLYPAGHEKAGQVERLIRNAPWKECMVTGYDAGKPPWMAVWLLIIADNALHFACNAAAFRWL